MGIFISIITLPFRLVARGISSLANFVERNVVGLTMVCFFFYLMSRAVRPLHQYGVLMTDHNDLANWIITVCWFLITTAYMAGFYLSSIALGMGWLLGLVFPGNISQLIFGRYGRPATVVRPAGWGQVRNAYFGHRLWPDIRRICANDAEAHEVMTVLLVHDEPILVNCLIDETFCLQKANEARVVYYNLQQHQPV